jgi:tRNA pseudouridine38-40 synthase
MKRFALRIAYDGTNYHGWQIQPNGITVQEVLENALSEIAKTKIKVNGSGRTDSGVHALNQIAHIDFPINMTEEQIVAAITRKIPNDIRILSAVKVNEDFNSRFDAIERKYFYLISKERNPFNLRYTTNFARKKIKADIIPEYCNKFIGKHDFSAFSKPNPDVPNHVCNIKMLNFYERENDFYFEIVANRFLHNMVRRIVGTIINLTNKDFNPDLICDLLKMKSSNQKYIITAPPTGLFLAKVSYPNQNMKNEMVLAEKFCQDFLGE